MLLSFPKQVSSCPAPHPIISLPKAVVCRASAVQNKGVGDAQLIAVLQLKPLKEKTRTPNLSVEAEYHSATSDVKRNIGRKESKYKRRFCPERIGENQSIPSRLSHPSAKINPQKREYKRGKRSKKVLENLNRTQVVARQRP